MSQKAIDKIQAMQQQDPSLSQRIEAFLESLTGEPTEYFMVFFNKRDDGKTLVSTAGWLLEENAKDAPRMLFEALANSGDGYVRIRAEDTGKH